MPFTFLPLSFVPSTIEREGEGYAGVPPASHFVRQRQIGKKHSVILRERAESINAVYRFVFAVVVVAPLRVASGFARLQQRQKQIGKQKFKYPVGQSPPPLFSKRGITTKR
jgi:hypothetical protein